MKALILALVVGCYGAPRQPTPVPPVERLTQLGDGTYSDSFYGIQCERGDFSLDGGLTCERGCGPLDRLDRYCSTQGEVLHDAASGAALRPPLIYASVYDGACSRIVKTTSQAPDQSMPVWDCDDATMAPIADFYIQPGRFYLVVNATEYDLP